MHVLRSMWHPVAYIGEGGIRDWPMWLLTAFALAAIKRSATDLL